ncbi:MAG: transporter, partial [Bacteroidia bacterium]|nr:transporter [Bacteroidia bacterium]
DVKADKINPVLDVTFDGFRIINGDFVSPKTTIRITSKDDSKFKLQNDTSSFVVYLRKPSQTDYQQVSIGSNEMQFIPASNSQNKALLEYKPLLAEEGMYSLKVLSKDASGNLSGSNFYEVDFNVTTKSSITNFYPYPNPATTNIKFVFTVTGTIPPDRLLIRIMTVSGKIVKEITQDDFGPMKIGQNISQYSWDGTDNYGDRLANGVYLYKVITRIDKEALEHRETTGDKFFSNQVGKIFLMK